MAMKIKQVICPRCKVDHEVYFHSHHEFTDTRCDECSIIDLTIGQSARYVKDNKIYTIAEINNTFTHRFLLRLFSRQNYSDL